MSKRAEWWPWYIRIPVVIAVLIVAFVLIGLGCELIYDTFALIRRL